MVRLIQGHPIVDGNKRTGVVDARVFLQLNGVRLFGAAAYKRRLERLAVDVAQRHGGGRGGGQPVAAMGAGIHKAPASAVTVPVGHGCGRGHIL